LMMQRKLRKSMVLIQFQLLLYLRMVRF
jgi:Thioredoxin.